MSFLLGNLDKLIMLAVIPIEEPDRLVSFLLGNRTGLKMLVVIPIEESDMLVSFLLGNRTKAVIPFGESDKVEYICCHSCWGTGQS
jgi:hypothetical protein